MKITAHFDGRGLAHLIQALPGDVDAMNRELAEVTLDIANERVPVDTGQLRDSGDMGRAGDGYEVFYDTEYAGYVHFGTSRMAARPWLAEAVAEVQGYRQRLLADLAAKLERSG